jgi:TetR/AcrR family transcriptional regulator, transcriptional repressor for nem operon
MEHAPMTTKGERTRAAIIERSAALMNRQGFLSAPVSAVIEATGIQKGGLYRHFESREALAYEALDHAVAQVRARFAGALLGRTGACEQLLALLDAYGEGAEDIPLAGGCPIMNTAIETDHAHPGLRRRAQAAMRGWHGMLHRIVETGVRAGQIRAGTDPPHVATVFIACIEGAVMLTHLYGDATHFRIAREHLTRYVERELRRTEAAP